jgi:leucyl aminopeptidase
MAPALASERNALVAADGLAPALGASIALGALLRSWRFDRYRTREKEEDKPKLERIEIAVADAAAAKAAFAPMRAVADGVFLARELVSEPPNVLTPAEFAERLKGLERLGLEVEVVGPKEMKRLGFGAFLGVASGSALEPRMVVMTWRGAAKGKRGQGQAALQKPLAFIGKGVTFDTAASPSSRRRGWRT